MLVLNKNLSHKSLKWWYKTIKFPGRDKCKLSKSISVYSKVDKIPIKVPPDQSLQTVRDSPVSVKKLQNKTLRGKCHSL